MSSSKIAYLAGGCFWGMEDLFRRLPGVTSTRVGYMGGMLENPTYNDVRTGSTGHAESIEVAFNPALTRYEDILALFFQIHDPSTANRQGNDRGTQYRSVIFAQDDEQNETAKDVIRRVDGSGLWPGKAVTEILDGTELKFWEAEDFHQDYLEKHPGGYTCHFPRPNWRLPD